MTKPIVHCFALTLLGLTACGFPSDDCTRAEPITGIGGGGPGTAELLFVVWAGSWIYCGVKLAIDGGQMQRQADAGDAHSQSVVGRQAISEARWDDAHAYLCRAAKQGHIISQYFLGEFRTGSVRSMAAEVPEEWHNLVEAYAWYSLVAKTDSLFYADLARDRRYAVAARLSHDAMAEAEALADGDVLQRCEAAAMAGPA